MERVQQVPAEFSVGVEAHDFGGFGDVSHAIKVAHAVRDGGYNTAMIVERQVEPLLGRFVLQNIQTLAYEEGVDAEAGTLASSAGSHIRTPYSFGMNAIIGVCASPNTELLEKDVACVEVGEFGDIHTRRYLGSSMASNPDKQDYIIHTGFKLYPELHDSIQAGISYSADYDKRVMHNMQHRAAIRGVLGETFFALTGMRISLVQQRLGLHYLGDRRSNFYYFDIVDEAVRHMSERVAIVVATPHHHGEMAAFMKVIDRLGFNYFDKHIQEDRGNQVTIIRPGPLPNETFLALETATDLPNAITGDQTLAEGIQHVTLDPMALFFYYCPIRAKQPDFIDFVHDIDPAVAHLLASYIAYETPPDYAPTPSKPSPYTRYVENPLPKKELARLFYDQAVVRRVQDAIRQFPAMFIEQRKDFVADPEGLVNSNETILTVLRDAQTGDHTELRKIMM